MPNKKCFPLICLDDECPPLIPHLIPSNKKRFVVGIVHAEPLWQMEGMVTACVEGEPVWWRIRQQQEEFCYLVQNGNIRPNHDGLYCAQMAQTLIVMLRRCLSLRHSRYPQLIKWRWSVDGGIDYFNGDADENVSATAQTFLMVKMAGRRFGRKKIYGLTVTVSSEPWCMLWLEIHLLCVGWRNHGILKNYWPNLLIWPNLLGFCLFPLNSLAAMDGHDHPLF